MWHQQHAHAVLPLHTLITSPCTSSPQAVLLCLNDQLYAAVSGASCQLDGPLSHAHRGRWLHGRPASPYTVHACTTCQRYAIYMPYVCSVSAVHAVYMRYMCRAKLSFLHGVPAKSSATYLLLVPMWTLQGPVSAMTGCSQQARIVRPTVMQLQVPLVSWTWLSTVPWACSSVFPRTPIPKDKPGSCWCRWQTSLRMCPW